MNKIQLHLEELKEFQTCFNSTYNTQLTFQPKDIIDLRINMYDEEAEEFLKFFRLKNKVEILDAISDELFLLFGDIVTIGLGENFVSHYIEYKKEYFKIYKNYSELGSSAPKMITLQSLSETYAMNNYINIDKTFTDEELIDMEFSTREYFMNRLLLLEVKGFLLYGENYGDILDEALTIVFNSNMSKLDENKNPIINGSNGVLVSDKPIGKVLKSDKYWQPTDKLNEILVKNNLC